MSVGCEIGVGRLGADRADTGLAARFRWQLGQRVFGHWGLHAPAAFWWQASGNGALVSLTAERAEAGVEGRIAWHGASVEAVPHQAGRVQ